MPIARRARAWPIVGPPRGPRRVVEELSARLGGPTYEIARDRLSWLRPTEVSAALAVTGAGARVNRFLSRRACTFSRGPSATGTNPPNSRRASSTWPARRKRLKAEVREKVRREDRLVHLEALVLRLAFPVAVREGLQSLRAPVACIPDRREERATASPTGSTPRRGTRTSRAPRRPTAGRQAARQRAGRAPRVRTASTRARRRRRRSTRFPTAPTPSPPSRSTLRLSVVRPSRDCHQTQSWHTAGASCSVTPVQTGDARPAHAGPISSTITSTASGSTFAIRAEVRGNAALYLACRPLESTRPTRRRDGARPAPGRRPAAIRTPLCLWRRALHEPSHPVDLPRRVGGIAPRGCRSRSSPSRAL